MEIQGKRSISVTTKADKFTVASSHTVSYNDDHHLHGQSLSLPVDSRARSSVSSNHSSLSHGSSPGDAKTPTTPPASVQAKAVNRSLRHEYDEAAEINGGGRLLRASLKKAALGFRILGMLFCLISFSVMAADKNQGWALDSSDRYMEFRYCMWVNVIGFVYSGLQACYTAYHLATGKCVFGYPMIRNYLDFSLDQILSYLLISASSSAAIRVDDWKANWGKDKFPEMASTSVAMSFMAFVALASSSLISGSLLFTFTPS